MKSDQHLIVIPLSREIESLSRSLAVLQNFERTEILIVDDGTGSTLHESNDIDQSIRCVHHELPLGYGGAFITGYTYARDFEFGSMIILDPECEKIENDLPMLIEQLRYGYDIISCSRILENMNFGEIPQPVIEATGEIATRLRMITNYDLTDPLSGNKAIKVESLADMELTEFGRGVFLQLWIQAAHFGLNVLELPSETESINLGREFDDYEDPLGHYLSVIESEEQLYKKGDIY